MNSIEKFNLGYSIKNIPIPSRNQYLKALISKTEHFLKRLRWKAFFHDHQNEDFSAKNKETFGFKTPHTPPKHELLEKFEDDMYTLISSIEFRKGKSKFQRKLDEDLRELKKIGKSNCGS